MAVDTQIVNSAPGIASFAQESFADAQEIRMSDDDWSETVLPLAPVGFALDLPIFSVVDESGRLAEQAGLAGTEPYAVLTSPINVLDGQTASVSVIRSGHLNLDLMNWDATFTTDALKLVAFEGSPSPTIFVAKPKLSSANLY